MHGDSTRPGGGRCFRLQTREILRNPTLPHDANVCDVSFPLLAPHVVQSRLFDQKDESTITHMEEDGGGGGSDEPSSSYVATAYARVQSAPSRQARGEGNVVETPDGRALFSMERVGKGGETKGVPTTAWGGGGRGTRKMPGGSALFSMEREGGGIEGKREGFMQWPYINAVCCIRGREGKGCQRWRMAPDTAWVSGRQEARGLSFWTSHAAFGWGCERM